MNSTADLINVAQFAGVDTISENVVCVGPGSLKTNPPSAIHVCSVVDFRAVNSEYSNVSSGSLGTTRKETGSIAANAKFR